MNEGQVFAQSSPQDTSAIPATDSDTGRMRQGGDVPAPAGGTLPDLTHIPSIQSQPPAAAGHDLPESHSGLPILLKIAFGLGIFFILGIGVIFGLSLLHHQSSSSGKVTLTYWGLFEDKNTMDPILADFTKQYPNISVNYIQQDPQKYTQRLVTRIQGGNGPDVFRLHDSWVPFLQPLMSPLTKDTMTLPTFDSTYYPTAKSDLVKNGAIYAIPAEIDTLSMCVNTSLFQKAGVSVPTNWNDFVSIARILTVTDANGKIITAGADMGTTNNVNHASDIISMLFTQSDVNPVNFSNNAQNAADALSFYTSFATGKNAVWDGSLDPAIKMFARGNLAMFFCYSWDIFQIQTLNPSLQFAVYPVPHLPGTNQTTASYWAEGISARSTHQKEAQLLVAYLAQKETAQKLYTQESKSRAFGEPYAQVSLASSVQGNKLVAPFLASAPNAVSTYFSADTDDDAMNNPLNKYLSDAITSILEGTSAQSALTTLSDGAAQIFSRYGIK